MSNGMIAGLPSNLVTLDIQRIQEGERRHQAEVEADAKAAYEAEVAKAEAEWTDSLYAKTEAFRENEPPAASELGVDVAGLSPARATLVRFAAWLGQTRDECRRLEAARDKFLTEMGAPAVTEKQLADLIAKDKSGFLAWLKGGADQGSKPDVDGFRRKQIEAKLAADTHQAEVARDSLKALEDEIAVLRKAVEVLDERHSSFARAALVEHAAARVRRYDELANELRDVVTDLAGLGTLAGSGAGFVSTFRPSGWDISLPAFAGVQPKLSIGQHAIAKASKPWLEMERGLIADPRVDLGTK